MYHQLEYGAFSSFNREVEKDKILNNRRLKLILLQFRVLAHRNFCSQESQSPQNLATIFDRMTIEFFLKIRNDLSSKESREFVVNSKYLVVVNS